MHLEVIYSMKTYKCIISKVYKNIQLNLCLKNQLIMSGIKMRTCSHKCAFTTQNNLMLEE